MRRRRPDRRIPPLALRRAQSRYEVSILSYSGERAEEPLAFAFAWSRRLRRRQLLCGKVARDHGLSCIARAPVGGRLLDQEGSSQTLGHAVHQPVRLALRLRFVVSDERRQRGGLPPRLQDERACPHEGRVVGGEGHVEDGVEPGVEGREARRARACEAQHLQRLDVGRPFPHGKHLGIAVEPRRRIFLGVAVTAEYLDRPAGRGDCPLCREILGERGDEPYPGLLIRFARAPHRTRAPRRRPAPRSLPGAPASRRADPAPSGRR